jgi:hypothetical protein
MIIPIQEANAGMILRESVKDSIGRILLPAGAELAERQIEKLQSWGIENIDIEPQDTGEDAGNLLGIKEDPLMDDLRQLAEEHILQNPAAWDFVQVEETK